MVPETIFERNIPKTEGFYSQLFGWKMNTAGIASMIDINSTNGIGGHITALGHEPHHYTMPPVKIPGGTFAWIADPDGNTVGLWKSQPPPQAG